MKTWVYSVNKVETATERFSPMINWKKHEGMKNTCVVARRFVHTNVAFFITPAVLKNSHISWRRWTFHL